MLAIINAELVMRDHLIPEAVILVEDGQIAGFGEMRSTPIPEGCEIMDAKGLYVGPGLVDIHCHSGTGVRFIHDPVTAQKEHLECGTTSILATPSTRGTLPGYLEQIGLIRKAMEAPTSTPASAPCPTRSVPISPGCSTPCPRITSPCSPPAPISFGCGVWLPSAVLKPL